MCFNKLIKKKSQTVMKLGFVIVFGIFAGVVITPRLFPDTRYFAIDTAMEPMTRTESAIFSEKIAAINFYNALSVLAIMLSCCAVLITSVIVADYYRKEEKETIRNDY